MSKKALSLSLFSSLVLLLLPSSAYATITISYTPTGGDCPLVGSWDLDSKTCTLTQDIADDVELYGSPTLDGAGHTVTPGASNFPTGVYVNSNQGSVINTNISGFPQGIVLGRVSYGVVNNNTISYSNRGLVAVRSHHAEITNNTFISTPPYQGSYAINLVDSSDNLIQNNILQDTGVGISLGSQSNRNEVHHNQIKVNRLALSVFRSSDNLLYNNDVEVSPSETAAQWFGGGVNNNFNQDLPVGGNWWSAYDQESEGCFDDDNNGFCDDPFVFFGGQDNFPHVNPVNQEDTGNSNVLFLPGFQATRLIEGSNELWVPGPFGNIEKLFLDDSGQPINGNIQAGQVIDEAYSLNVYKSFLGFLEKDLVGQGIINEWRALPYDWRLPLDDLAANPNFKQELLELAETSQNGKVTLVGHSNGGNLAKLLLNNEEIADKVDKLILVATPQLGTPKATGALLHGFKQDLALGFILEQSQAREFGENMVSAYTLMPSAKYFDTVADPIFSFDQDASEEYDFATLYGSTINSFSELTSFLTGEGGIRIEPHPANLRTPNVLDQNLLSRAQDIQTQLDRWQTPADIEVIQIAGWGLDTVKQFNYSRFNCAGCETQENLPFLDVEPVFTFDGDETVVTGSAGSFESQKYYLNLRDYNNSHFVNHDHAEITEVQSLRELVSEIMANEDVSSESLEFITENIPEPPSSAKSYRLLMKSPVAVHVYDSDGRHHVGLKDNPNPDSNIQLYDEQIPNSSYLELGSKKYISLDDNDTYNIELDGEDSGVFTFEIEEVQGDEVVNTVAFNTIPTTSELSGDLTLNPEEFEQTRLELDIDGDEENDISLQNQEALPADASLDLLQQAIDNLDVHRSVTARLTAWTKNVSKFVDKGKSKQAKHHADKLFKKTKELMDKKKNGLTVEQAEPLLEMVASIIETL